MQRSADILREALPRPVRLAARRAVALARRGHRAWRGRAVAPHPRPVFILGHQKTGTSAIAALLAARTGQELALDLQDEIDRPAAHRVYLGELTLDVLLRRNRLDFSRAIIKEPSLTILYPQLAARFPTSPFVFITRDPRDTIRSILDRLSLRGDAPDLSPAQRAQLTHGWDLILYGQWLGLTGKNYVEFLAARWNRFAEIYGAHRDHLILVRYEEFLKDKLHAIDCLAADVGLQPLHDISGILDRPYQSVGRRDADWGEVFGAERLARIEDICAAGMRLFGYRPTLSR